jgi:hypothetical protein
VLSEYFSLQFWAAAIQKRRITLHLIARTNFAAADRVPFAGPAAEPPWAAQASRSVTQLQIALCGFRSGAAGGASLCRCYVA